MNKKYELSKILPHDAPMIFLDELLNVDLEKNSVTTSVTITKDKILFDREINGISALAGIEFMAQTIGCYAYFQNKLSEPKIGFLLGSRFYEADLEKFELGKTYTIFAQQAFSDNELVSFECFIYNEGKECAKAKVNVYQPLNRENLDI